MPDVNPVPTAPSGVGAARSVRTSVSRGSQPQQQPAPQSPLVSASSDLNLLPSNQQAFQERPPSLYPGAGIPVGGMASSLSGQDASSAGPHPLPRPLTAAELHSQLEQEQELIVNRLSRELALLQSAQSWSVASNASSASVSNSAADHLHSSSFTDTHMMSGPGYPAPATRPHHRTSSSASTRSYSQTGTLGALSSPIPIPQPHSSSAASVLEAARHPRGASSMSRQNSTTSHRSSSRNRSPHPYMVGSSAVATPHSQSHGYPFEQAGRDPASASASVVATPGSELSPWLMPATPRFEETALQRQELENLKRENAALRQRIRDLEKLAREQKEGETMNIGRTRSGSNSTTTSLSVSGTTGVGGAMGGGTGIAGGRREERRGIDRTASTMSVAGSVGVGVPEEELKVGESAASFNPREGGSRDESSKETK
ncbi:hypothetical protein F5Y17DRAFT_450153 [Xylariaceae sp. FL0594]|nr:hypothetical protein F5Y17DRAFT_450153 [Xylariaceae sp. FL0594]